jgi:hypothetical protein
MTVGADETQDKFKAFLLQTAEAFAPFPLLRDQEREIRAIAQTVDSPFTLAVFGRMKTGKSSIINALLGTPLTITGVEEATATLNWISFGDPAQRDSAIIHWKDGRTEPIPLFRISEWAGKDPAVLERVRDTAFLQLFAEVPFLRNVHIVDTPGTGAVVDEHEKVAREFLSPRAAEESEAEGRKADALLYVFAPEGRDNDQETLGEFSQTRLPGSDPYNSIGVLHLWDALEADDVFSEARRKAERLTRILGNVVSEVIPVSAPLALAARDSPDTYFESLLELTSRQTTTDNLVRKLKTSDRWDGDKARKQARDSYKLPWASFVRVVQLLIQHSCDSVSDAREVCLHASGFEKLEAALESRFFKRAALIKQRLTRVKVKRPIDLGLMKFNDQIERLSSDLRHFSGLLSATPKGSPHHAWLTSKEESCKTQVSELEAHAEAADRQRLVEEHRMTLLENDLAFLEAMHQHPEWIEDRDREGIRNLLTGASNGEEKPSRMVLESVLKRYAPMMHSPTKVTRRQFEHLIQRMQHALGAGTLPTP